MISPNYILIFLIGFLVGAGLIAVIAWYLNFKKLNNVQNPRDELIALRTEMAETNARCISGKPSRFVLYNSHVAIIAPVKPQIVK